MQKRRLNRKRFITVIFVLLITILIVILALNNDKLGIGNTRPTPTPLELNTALPTQSIEPEPSDDPQAPKTIEPSETSQTTKPPKNNLVIRTDYEEYLPNESGEIPIVMFHTLIEAYKENTEKEYTTTFTEFEALLHTLYDADFRLISMSDFIDCNIKVPAGKIPMVLTFDDGTPGQFNLIEENGELRVNPKSAAGIILSFNEKYPDFGTNAIFYVNMDAGDKLFDGAGDVKKRIEILQSYGFELGNHTWGHADYTDPNNNNPDKVQMTLGKNQEKASQVLSSLKFYSLALPYGHQPKNEGLISYLENGRYNDTDYENKSIMAVGANPTVPSINKNYNNKYVARIRAQGRVAVDCDLTWWIPKMTKTRMFVSDGDPNTIVVPSDKVENVLNEKLNGKELITY